MTAIIGLRLHKASAAPLNERMRMKAPLTYRYINGHRPAWAAAHKDVESTYECGICYQIVMGITGAVHLRRSKRAFTDRQFGHWMANKDLMVEMLRLEMVNGY